MMGWRSILACFAQCNRTFPSLSTGITEWSAVITRARPYPAGEWCIAACDDKPLRNAQNGDTRKQIIYLQQQIWLTSSVFSFFPFFSPLTRPYPSPSVTVTARVTALYSDHMDRWENQCRSSKQERGGEGEKRQRQQQASYGKRKENEIFPSLTSPCLTVHPAPTPPFVPQQIQPNKLADSRRGRERRMQPPSKD